MESKKKQKTFLSLNYFQMEAVYSDGAVRVACLVQ